MPNFASAAIRTAVKNKVAGVANIGVVYDYERYTKEAARLAALYVNQAQSGKRLYGWFVSLRSWREVYQDIGRWVRDCEWQLTGYMGLDDVDATEKKLADEIDLIADAFRADDNLGGAVDTLIIDSGGGTPIRGLQLAEMDKVLFANVLCHRARCALVTRSWF